MRPNTLTLDVLFWAFRIQYSTYRSFYWSFLYFESLLINCLQLRLVLRFYQALEKLLLWKAKRAVTIAVLLRAESLEGLH
jgi:hypothetical protein